MVSTALKSIAEEITQVSELDVPEVTSLVDELLEQATVPSQDEARSMVEVRWQHAVACNNRISFQPSPRNTFRSQYPKDIYLNTWLDSTCQLPPKRDKH